MSENKKYDLYLYIGTIAVFAAVLLFFKKEYAAAAILFVASIISAYLAEKNHSVKIIKIKPKEA